MITMAVEILTLAELAQLLRVAEKTVYTMAQNAEIPCFKVRGQWRFRKHDIDAWIASEVAKAKKGGGFSPKRRRSRRNGGRS